MAEKAAHLTTTIHPKPSLFEIIAHESLNSTVHPALQKIVQFLTSYNPRRYNWLTEYGDEIYLSVNGLIQYYYLKNYGASFSEHFYGLKRVSAVKLDEQTINLKEKKLCFILLVVLPYVKIKIEEKLTQYRLELADGILLNNWKRKLKSLLCHSHSFLHISYSFWSISQYIKYMSGSTDIQTPDLRILSLKLTYTELEQNHDGFWSTLFKGNLTASQLTSGLLGQAFQNSLEIGAFFVQFLQSWQMEQSHVSLTALPTPKPPSYDPKAMEYKKKCPLCMQSWSVPTVLSVSGYIYCFRCIIGHLHGSKTCPVTKLPATMGDIFRLYENHTV